MEVTIIVTGLPLSLVGATLAVVLTGCGDGEAESPQPAATVTATATVTAEPPKVETTSIALGNTPSLRMCNDIFGTSNYLDDITTMWSRDTLTLRQITKAYSDVAMLTGQAMDAGNPIHDLLVTIIDETEDYLEWVESEGGPETWDTTAFTGAGRKLTTHCTAVFDAEDPEPSPPPPPPKAVTVPGDGVFQVGRDVPPGTYRSPGSKGPGYMCVVYASSNPSDLGTYLRGSTLEGPTIITVNEGEFLNTQFCQPFRRD